MGGVRAGGLYGALEMLILRGLELSGPMHGVGVADHIASKSGGLFKVEEGSLYPALHRLQAAGYVEGEWVKTESGKRAKHYAITERGRRAAARERDGWLERTRAILSILDIRDGEVP